MDIVRKCKRVLGRSRGCHPESDGSSSYGRLSDKPSRQKKKRRQAVAPQGYFSVYVGPERERFLIKIELANHPSFKTLLDDAENEHGYRNDGPLALPCDVDLFCEALAEMKGSEDDTGFVGCTFPKGRGSSSVFHSPLSSRSNLSRDNYELLI